MSRGAEARDDRLDGKSDLFLIPALNGYLLYNPLGRQIALINDSAARDVVAWAARPDRPVREEGAVGRLKSSGILDIPSRDDISGKHESPWAPSDLFVSVTQKCTLRCTYCYADGGRLRNLDIPWNIARTAIDMTIRNALSKGVRPGIQFLGEGEATASWNRFQEALEYFERRCGSAGIKGYVALTTNGVFPPRFAAYIGKHCNRVTMSIDGLPHVHNAHRVLPDGTGSFDQAIANYKRLETSGVECNIRSTASRCGLLSLIDFVEYLAAHTRCKTLHIEPSFDYSNTMKLSKSTDSPRPSEFVSYFRKARPVAARYGIELYYSGSDMRLRSAFCGASGAHNFVVTTAGIVSSCVEVLQSWDKRSSCFHYGSWSERSNDFSVDPDRIARLSELNIAGIRRCRGCFAKYNCAGHCYSRNAAVFGGPVEGDFREECEIPRELIKDELILALLKERVSEGCAVTLPKAVPKNVC